MCDIFLCVFVTFICGIPGQVYLIVSIPDLCLIAALSGHTHSLLDTFTFMHLTHILYLKWFLYLKVFVA